MELLNLCNFLRQKKLGREGEGGQPAAMMRNFVGALSLFFSNNPLTANFTKQTNNPLPFQWKWPVWSHTVCQSIPASLDALVGMSLWAPWATAISISYISCMYIFPILMFCYVWRNVCTDISPPARGYCNMSGGRLSWRQTSIWKHLC